MAYQVKDKVFFVTGGSSGIGAEVIKIIIAEEAKFVVNFDINVNDGVSLQNEYNSRCGEEKVRFIKGDVTDYDHFVDSLKAIKEEMGLDVLINNAGILNDTLEMFRREIEINVSAVITGSLYALNLMRKDDGGNGGTIINISSGAALGQIHTLPVYAASKSAVLQFSNCLGLKDYFARTGVRVLAICFSHTDTPLVSSFPLFDKRLEKENQDLFDAHPQQSSEEAAQGLVHAFKHGESGSTWLRRKGLPITDITANMRKAYQIMATGILDEED